MSNDNREGLDSIKRRMLLSDRIKTNIEAYSIERYKKEYKKRLGGSMIGEDCWQKLWLTFRWCKSEEKTGRMYRLLDRGNREENYTFSLLSGIGFELHTINPQTDEQYNMSYFGGHVGGSLDGIAIMPTSWEQPEPMLLSVKTSGTGAKFNKYGELGVKVAAPSYFDQECFYGHGYGINYALWVVTNKNDDDIHIEVEQLDIKRGEQLYLKAGEIVQSQKPFPKISKSPAGKECAGCHFKGVCHKGEPVDKNCRSCVKAQAHPEPHSDGTPAWFCNEAGLVIPVVMVRHGCETWEPIINAKP